MTNPMYFEPLISFAAWLTREMDNQQINVAQLSRLSGISASAIAGYLKSEHEPSLFATCCLCHALGFTVGVKGRENVNREHF